MSIPSIDSWGPRQYRVHYQARCWDSTGQLLFPYSIRIELISRDIPNLEESGHSVFQPWLSDLTQMILFQDYIRLNQVVSFQRGRYVISLWESITKPRSQGRKQEAVKGRENGGGKNKESKEEANSRHAQSVDHQRLSENSSRNHTRKTWTEQRRSSWLLNRYWRLFRLEPRISRSQ